MFYQNISLKEQLRALIVGIMTSWAAFAKYGRHIYYFDVPNSLIKDWSMVKEDIEAAIKKFEGNHAAKQKKS